jgi:UDP-N-acetylglucosamine 1-carboxyvinyltransferase
MESFTAKLVEMGVDLQINEDSIYVPRSNDLDPIRVKTMTYPGFATDLQQPITPLLLRANGSSVVIDTIYPQRTQHVEQLRKMGADIRVQDNLIVVGHSSHLQGAHVEAGEIRSGAALMIAGLAASGVTEISRADNILRGYDRVIDKLHTLGADVEIAADEEVPEN